MPAIRETTPADLSRIAQFLNGLDELAAETGIRVGFGTELVDLRTLHDNGDGEAPSEATFDLAVRAKELPGPQLGEVLIRHCVEWGR